MKKPSIKKLLTVLAIMTIAGLVFYNTKDLFLGAPLSVNTASDGTTVSDAFLPISGTARHASFVEINGRKVAIDKNGSFNDGALLSPGYNIIEIVGKDRFGKEKHKVFHLVAEPSSSVASAMSIHYQ